MEVQSILANVPGLAFVYLNEKDVVRHELCRVSSRPMRVMATATLRIIMPLATDRITRVKRKLDQRKMMR
jgi:hypothetical protein